jgi:hypothetical protein
MKTKFLALAAITVMIMQICLISSLTISSASSMPPEIQPGEKLHLTLKIENDLSQDVSDVAVSLTLNNPSNPTPFAPYESSNEDVIERVDEGERETANFELISKADAASGTYLIPVQITYTGEDDNQTKSEPFLISLIINAKPTIQISAEDPVLIKGTSGKLTLKVVNSGLGDSKFLSVSVSRANGLQLTSPESIYIGNIDSNDFDTADFNMFVAADAASNIGLPVKITYSDSMNNQVSENITIIINTYTKKEAISLGLIPGSSALLIIIFIVIIVIAYFVYRSIRKRRRNKRNRL